VSAFAMDHGAALPVRPHALRPVPSRSPS
jgi:hypothetical protein